MSAHGSIGRKLNKQRARERKAVAAAEVMATLTAAGSLCGNCAHFSDYPFQADSEKKMICVLGSDFYGYQIAKAEGLCVKWSAKEVA